VLERGREGKCSCLRASRLLSSNILGWVRRFGSGVSAGSSGREGREGDRLTARGVLGDGYFCDVGDGKEGCVWMRAR
jgi:hypothetical protein